MDIQTWQPEQLAITTNSVVSAAACPVVTAPFALELRPTLDVTSLRFDGRIAAAVSLPMAPPKFKIASYTFGPTGGWRSHLPQTAAAVDPTAAAQPAIAPPATSPDTTELKPRTRILPPGDVIKLEDRLFYVLQPSLEAMIGDSSLSFPAHPIPYQFEGIAFLYPR